MSVKFETVKAGDVLFDCHREQMGNTTMRALGVWRVKVLEVDATGATISWNGNAPERVSAHHFRALRRSPPEWIYEPFRGHYCALCHQSRDDGHRATCSHPKAALARKKAGQ